LDRSGDACSKAPESDPRINKGGDQRSDDMSFGADWHKQYVSAEKVPSSKSDDHVCGRGDVVHWRRLHNVGSGKDGSVCLLTSDRIFMPRRGAGVERGVGVELEKVNHGIRKGTIEPKTEKKRRLPPMLGCAFEANERA
jgi:hypothetical protein